MGVQDPQPQETWRNRVGVYRHSQNQLGRVAVRSVFRRNHYVSLPPVRSSASATTMAWWGRASARSQSCEAVSKVATGRTTCFSAILSTHTQLLDTLLSKRR